MSKFLIVWISLGVGFVLGTIWTGYFNAAKEAEEVQADADSTKRAQAAARRAPAEDGSISAGTNGSGSGRDAGDPHDDHG